MARTIRDAKLDSRTARLKLPAKGKPFFRSLDPGLHLGYRRLPGDRPGRWVARFYAGGQTYEVQTFATADDLSNANGVDVLDFKQAQEEVRRRRDVRVRGAAGVGPFTVADAVTAYLKALEAEGKKTADTLARANAMILPALGDAAVAELTAEQLRTWLMKLASTPPRMRTPEGASQRHHKASDELEAVRRRRSTANRVLAILRAALSHSWRHGKTPSDAAWRRIRPFSNVSSARVRYLSLAECSRLINASDPDFRNLLVAALQTGARYGEITRLEVADFNPDVSTLAIRQSKSGKSRHVVLTSEGSDFFAHLCAGRAGSEILLRKGSGQAWGRSHQADPMRAACRRAGITPPVNFHQLRHTWASLAIMNGVPLLIVARNLGHRDGRMCERHYSHFAPGYIVDAIRAGAPRYGIEPDLKIARFNEPAR
jgi:integrase